MARTFDANGKYLANANYPQLVSASSSSQGAISVWMKPAFNPGDSTGHQFWWFGGASFDMPSFAHGSDNNVYVGFQPGAERRIIVADTGLYASGVWSHHYFDWKDGVTSVDPTTDARYFVNGVLVGTKGNGTVIIGGGYSNGVRVGNNMANNAPANADMAEFAVWRGRRLTLFEIGLLARGYSPAYFRQNLDAYIRVPGTANPEPDYFGDPIRPLTVTGVPVQATHPPIQFPTSAHAYRGRLPLRWRYGQTRINRAQPLAKDLKALFINAEGVGAPKDLVNRRRVQSATAAWGFGPYGRNSRSWTYTTASTTDLDFTSGPFTAVAFSRLYVLPTGTTLADFIARADYTSESVNHGWQLTALGSGFGPGANRFVWIVMNNNALTVTRLASATAIAIGDWLIAGTSDGTTRRIYVNGREEASTTNSPSPAAAVTGQLGATLNGGDAYHYWQGVWARCLTAGEVRQLWLQRRTIGGLLTHGVPTVGVPSTSPTVTSRVRLPVTQRNAMVRLNR